MQQTIPKQSKCFLGIKINQENLILLFFIFISLVISLFPVHYGYFRDELYFIALSKHLAFGYVDIPPLLPLCVAIVHFLFDTSLFTTKLIPAFCSVAVIILTRAMVKKLSGRLFAQTLALVCVVFAPAYFNEGWVLSVTALDRVFWAACLYMILLLLTSENKKYWLYFGFFAGLGLLSKITILWLGFSIVISLLFTRNRKYFLSWQLWAGGVIAFLMLTPYLIWIAQHQFLTIEFFSNYTGKTQPLSILTFIKSQIVFMNIAAAFVWILGLCYFIFNREGKKFRLLGFAYIIIGAICIIQNAKLYVIFPYYPILFAGGAFFIEQLTTKLNFYFKAAYILLIVIVAMIWLPMMRPILPVDVFIKYSNALHLFKSHQQSPTEKLQLGLLPQWLSDCFGWQEMTQEVARIYYSLPKRQREDTHIVTRNYGEAAAIDFYRKKYNLPAPISQHIQYFVWGYGTATAKSTFIFVGYQDRLTDLKHDCKELKIVGKIYNKYGIPEENQPIYLCTGLNKPIKEAWEDGKFMHM